MKCFFAILLSVSLYSPDIARIIAYTDYIVDTVSEKRINICDCEGVIQQNQQPPSDHQQEMSILATEFKYVATGMFGIVAFTSSIHKNESIHPVGKLSFFSHDIFQPPRV